MNSLWEQFQKGGDDLVREELITHYLPLVERIARRVASGLPRHILVDDLYATGVRGLMKAVDQFDSSRNSKFEGYATLLIKGAMIDELRANNWVPRSIIQKAAQVAKMQRELERRLGREATDEEMADHLELTPAKFGELLEKIRPAVILPLHESVEGDLSWAERIADERASCGEQAAVRAEKRALLEKKLRALPQQERKVLYLYYFEDMMLREIGELLDLSEGRISQIHTKALLHMRGELAGFEEEL